MQCSGLCLPSSPCYSSNVCVRALQKLYQQMYAFLLVSLQGQTQTPLWPFQQLVQRSFLLFPAEIQHNRLFTKHSVQLQRVTEHPKHGSPGTANYIDARTTWFDQAVLSARQQGIAQVVVIAAGFDTRAYRLHPQGLQVSSA